MSVLHFLPRLTSWGNLYSKGERTQDFSQNDSDDLLSLRNKIGNQRQIVPPLSKGRHRRKISYWSDNEEDKKYRRDLQRSFILLEIPLFKQVWFVLNHRYQWVGRCVLLNHHEWREWNDQNEWWFSRIHRPTSWLKQFRKNLTSLRWDFLLIQGLKWNNTDSAHSHMCRFELTIVLIHWHCN